MSRSRVGSSSSDLIRTKCNHRVLVAVVFSLLHHFLSTPRDDKLDQSVDIMTGECYGLKKEWFSDTPNDVAPS